MSFSSRAKAELCQARPDRKCCAVAESYGVLLYCNTFSANEIRVITASPEFSSRLPKLFRKAFGMSFDRLPPEGAEGKRTLSITDADKLSAIFDAFGADRGATLSHHINFGVIEEDCCRASFIRGAFLAGGSVTDPEKRYHLELSTSHIQASREVSALLQEMGFLPRSVMRGGSAVIYFKQSEHIEDLLTTLGAPVAATEIMTAKVDKEIRNGANRAMNCDMANVNKTLDAVAAQQEAIEKLEKSGQMEKLPEKIQETARLRMQNPELPLAQLAALFDPPISKSCLNHRIRKIMEEARKL